MVFFTINDVDIRKACKSPKMRLLSKLFVTLQPQWAPFVENMQSTQLKVKKQPFSVLAPQEPGSVLLRSQLAPQEPGSVLLRSPLRVGAPQEPGSVLLRSTPGSELLRSQGRCSSGAGARGGSCQERPSPTTPIGAGGWGVGAGHTPAPLSGGGVRPFSLGGWGPGPLRPAGRRGGGGGGGVSRRGLPALVPGGGLWYSFLALSASPVLSLPARACGRG